MRPIDADAYAAEMREKQDNCRVWKDSLDEGTELYARAEQSFVTFVEAALTLKSQPTIDAIPVVRCRYCRHRPKDNREMDNDMTGLSIEFPDSRCPCQCEDGWYSWYPPDDWFCANGERRSDDENED